MDEIYSLLYARMSWAGFWHEVSTREGNMIAYYLVLRGWIHLGDSQSVAKILSILFGVATVPAMYALGKQLYGRRVGRIGALLVTVSACHVRASQWIRSYSAMLLLLVLAAWFLARALEKPSFRNCSLYAISAALSVYCHVYGVLALGAQLVSVVLLPTREIPWKQLVVALAVLGLLLTPAAAYVVTHNSGQVAWLPAPKLWELVHWAVFLAGAGSTGVAFALLVICVGLCVFSFLQAWKIWNSTGRSFQSWRRLFPFVWLVLPVAISFLVSYLKPIFFFRYLIICWPPFVLGLADGIANWRPSRTRTGILATALCLSLVSVGLAYKSEEDWEGAMRYLLTHVHDGDTAFVGSGMAPLVYYSSRWYAPGAAAKLQLPDYEQTKASVPEFARIHPQVWVVVFPNFAPEGRTVELLRALTPTYCVQEEKKFRAVTIERLAVTAAER
ncbi:MAG TPA: glycosyltransferase family 39 protein [Terriglobales bacterium]|nr:glycosyltransferase family 39 protein [Terriglobales bacterium]